MQVVLSEMCTVGPERWSDYMSPAYWVKLMPSGPCLRDQIPPFELLFGRKSRMTPDAPVPLIYDSEGSGGLDASVEQRRQMLREVRDALEKRHGDRIESRRVANSKIKRPSAGTVTKYRNLVLVKGANSTIYRSTNKGKLDHERWKGS